jgi:hypothetical protein
MLIVTAMLSTSAFSWSSGGGYDDPQQVEINERTLSRALNQRDLIVHRSVDDLSDRLDEKLTTPKATKLDAYLQSMVAEVGKRSPDAIAARSEFARGSLVPVSIRIAGNADELVDTVNQHGGSVANIGTEVIEAYVPVDRLSALATQPDIVSLHGIHPGVPDVTGQGAGIHNAPHWNANGINGSGIKVGVIDGGFHGISSLIGSEISQVAGVRCFTAVGQHSANLAACENGAIHGTGVAEAINDVAPDVAFYLATPLSPLDLHNVVDWMASNGVSVINYSISNLYEGSGDGRAIYSDLWLAAIDKAAANGITWIGSSGNAGQATWMGQPSDVDNDGYMEFGDGDETNSMYLYQGQRISAQMRWQDTWGGARQDIDLVVINSNLEFVSISATLQDGSASAIPLEILEYTAPVDGVYSIVVGRRTGAAPGWVQYQVRGLAGNQALERFTGGSVSSPAESANPGMLAVGATHWNDPSRIESYSGQGPAPDGRIKPDITGVACADSVTYGVGDSAFCGTSQASPYVAGVAALVKQRFPHFTPTEMANYLKSTAQARGSVPNNTWGYGLAHLPEITGTEPTPTPNPPTGDPLVRTWERTDKPVADTMINRTWMWGPKPFVQQAWEPYIESPGGQRSVVYYDKSRMEVNNPNGDQNDPWYVTNGLLVVELVSGSVQTGNNEYQPRWPAQVNVAGDPDDAAGPTYATFNGLRNASPTSSGSLLTQRVNRSGGVWTDGSLAGYGVTAGPHVSETNHVVASPFWEFMNSSGLVYENGNFVNAALFENPFYATGYPITEPYWANVKLAGAYIDVLMQCFERRCLTFTPSNPDGWKVEAGNVGQHYHKWRYKDTAPVTPTPIATPTQPVPTPTQPAPTATPTQPAPTATPTQPSPTPTATQPSNGAPVEGAVTYQPDLSAFEPYTSSDGKVRAYWDPTTSSYVVEDSTVVGEDPSGFYTWWTSSSGMPRDYSVTIDVVTLTGDTSHDSTASLYYRLESNAQGATEFAGTDLTTSGWIGSYYLGPTEYLMLADFHQPVSYRTGYGAVNQMKAVVKGDHAWIYLNGMLVHDFTLDQRNSQLANGFAFATLRTGNSAAITRYGFRNVVIREVQ